MFTELVAHLFYRYLLYPFYACQVIDLSAKFSEAMRLENFGIVNERTPLQPGKSMKDSIFNDLRERTNAVAAVGKRKLTVFKSCLLGFVLFYRFFFSEFASTAQWSLDDCASCHILVVAMKSGHLVLWKLLHDLSDE